MFAASKTASVSGGYQISRSLRFNSPDSAYLGRTPASNGNRKTWTYSAWIKLSNLSSSRVTLLEQNLASSDTGFLLVSIAPDAQSNNLIIEGYNTVFRRTTASYRDFSAWYHIVVAVDTTQTTANNRIRLYINNVEVTAFGTTNNPAQNDDTGINSTGAGYIGREVTGSAYSNAYMTEVNLIDGTQLTPSSFGETNAQTGVWQPKAYSGSYGTNGFYLNFSDNSNTTAATLGKDYSGNGNNWTPNNFSVTAGAGNDSLVDSPTSYGTDTGVGGTVRGNYATVNPLQLISNVSVTNGNLYFQSNNNQDQFASAPSTIAVRTGKWYAEYTATTVGGTPTFGFGVARASWSPIILDGGGYYGRWWYTSEGYSYLSNGNFYTGNSAVSSAATFSNGDIIGVAMDLDAGSIAFYKNGTLQATPFTSIPLGVDYVFAGAAFTTPYPTPTNIAAFFANFGQRPFAYTAPSGFKALCTQNLPTPTIGATTATQANTFFAPALYTGNDGTQTVTTGIDMATSGGLVWFKNRSAAIGHALINPVVGYGSFLQSNSTSAENAFSFITATSSTGFTMNTGSSTLNGGAAAGGPFAYVAWNWKANGSGSTNTSGILTSQVSANTTAGFSVCTYTAPASSQANSFGHGLGVAPSMVLAKNRSSGTGGLGWAVYHSSLGANQVLSLNSTAASATVSGYWGSGVTSTVVGLPTCSSSTGFDNCTGNMVAYCFAEVAGYSKFGSYTGNGSADGVFVYTGFRPAYVLIKRTDTGGYDWWIMDATRSPANAVRARLYTNDSAAESSNDDRIDFVSNGIKIRNSDAGYNASGGTYIFMAFASNPFKYSLAR